MRIILIIATLVLSSNLFAQNDFVTLDKQTYDYYLKGDFKNLRKTGNEMLSKGVDYYYLRMRLGILAYKNQRYSKAVVHFTKALEFNSSDTISREYIYNSYLLSGRKADANLFLESLPFDKKNNMLKTERMTFLTDIFFSSSFSGSSASMYRVNLLYKRITESNLNTSVGFVSHFSSKIKGTFAFTNFRKTGTMYSSNSSVPSNLNVNQNQVYAKLTVFVFRGLEFSGFGHIAFYSDVLDQSSPGRRGKNQISSEYLGGAGILKNWWKIRAGGNISISNFMSSNQTRGEGYLTYLPFGNRNFYFTLGGMFQTDKYWGNTYQVNQEIGLKVFKSLWLESGIVKGNSFSYARNQGFTINNSFQIPVTTIYGNFIFLIGKRFSITLSPFYNKNLDYSWDLNTYTRTDKLTLNSFGGTIKLTFKNN